MVYCVNTLSLVTEIVLWAIGSLDEMLCPLANKDGQVTNEATVFGVTS